MHAWGRKVEFAYFSMGIEAVLTSSGCWVLLGSSSSVCRPSVLFSAIQFILGYFQSAGVAVKSCSSFTRCLASVQSHSKMSQQTNRKDCINATLLYGSDICGRKTEMLKAE